MNSNSEIIHKTELYVRSKLEGEGSGHDWWHILRVRNLALSIANNTPEQTNIFVIELAALLHDIADHKFNNGDEEIGAITATNWLKSLGLSVNLINHIADIIQTLSYKGAEVDTPMKTIEGKIVQDADRLDAIGAIGIARAFAYGGFKSRELYNPSKPPVMHTSFEEYKNDDGHTINHFYEKLLLIKDRLNTKAAIKIAEKRHQFMELYLHKFLAEWDGKL